MDIDKLLNLDKPSFAQSYSQMRPRDGRTVFNKFQDLSPQAKIAYQANQTGIDPKMIQMQHQMGDIEFQMEVAPYLGYSGPTEREMEMLRFDLGADDYNLEGMYTPRSVNGLTRARSGFMDNETYGVQAADEVGVILDPNLGIAQTTPNDNMGRIEIFGAKAATPYTISHEIGHSRGSTAEYPLYAAGVINAQTEDEYQTALTQYVSHNMNSAVKDYSSEDREKAVHKHIRNSGYAKKLYLDEFVRTTENPGSSESYVRPSYAYGKDGDPGIMSIILEEDIDNPADMYAENRFQGSLFGKKVADSGVSFDPRPSKIRAYNRNEDVEFYPNQAETLLTSSDESYFMNEPGQELALIDPDSESIADEEGLGSLIETIVGSTSSGPGMAVPKSKKEQKAMVREIAAMASLLRKAGAPIASEDDVSKLPPETLEQLNIILDRSPEE